MQTFTYSLFFKILFRYGNIFITLLLILYLVPLAVNLDKNLFLLIPFVISLVIIYALNRFYFLLYKTLPYKISADDEKIICNNFFMQKREVVIYYKNIKSVSGGVFDGRIRGIMKICDKNSHECITFSEKLNNSKKLITIILSKVDKEIYQEVIDRLQKLSEKYKRKRD